MFDFLGSLLAAIWLVLRILGIVELNRSGQPDNSREISPADRVRRLQKKDELANRSAKEEEQSADNAM